jgi:hypothetical protein
MSQVVTFIFSIGREGILVRLGGPLELRKEYVEVGALSIVTRVLGGGGKFRCRFVQP